MGGILAVFAVATVVVGAAGPRLARVTKEIADRVSIDDVLVGAVLLGVVTSLPGLVLTVSAAARGEAELAVANALGGVAAQTSFLAIADVATRGGPLSSQVRLRAVAFQAALLLTLLALVVIALGTANTQIWRIHPLSLVLVAVYVGGLAVSRDRSEEVIADEDELDQEAGSGDEPADDSGWRPWRALWTRFAVFAVLLSGAGYALSTSGSDLAASTGLSAGAVGIALTSVATSTPELVTAVSAARQGALALAAGDIIGGNTFDTLFIAAADLTDGGSVFASAGPSALAFTGVAILLNGIMLAGLVRRAVRADTDITSIAIIVVWLAAIVLTVV